MNPIIVIVGLFVCTILVGLFGIYGLNKVIPEDPIDPIGYFKEAFYLPIAMIYSQKAREEVFSVKESSLIYFPFQVAISIAIGVLMAINTDADVWLQWIVGIIISYTMYVNFIAVIPNIKTAFQILFDEEKK